MPWELFRGMPFSDYVRQMARDGTYDDQLTLRAASEIYNIPFTNISTLGAQGKADISPYGFDSIGRITLGHFAEGYGVQYVLLRESGTPSAENEDIDFSLEGRSGSGTKHKVIDERHRICG